MRKKIVISFAFVLLGLISAAQPSMNPQLHSVIPPSPDAASLGKYGDIPVNYATGVPDISIPIYTISQNGLKIPISVSYHAGGIKVEEQASWVGLGWSLNAGGVITRSVVGLPDEDIGGYFEQPYDIYAIENLEDKKAIAEEIGTGFLDLEPDNYYFNFLGRSGKFYIDRSTMKAVIIPTDSKLSITFNTASHNIINWTITDENGFVYHFSTKEYTWTQAGGRLKSGLPMNQTVFSTWYLDDITTPFNNNITFNYQNYTCDYYTRQSSTKYYFLGSTGGGSCTTPTTENHVYDHTVISGKRISSIVFDNGRVDFLGTVANREDMTGDYALEKIRIYDKNNTLIKDYHFLYSYFQSSAGQPALSFTPTTKRLRLDRVEVGPLSQPQVYSFEYEGPNLPSIFSRGQDHWGYNNGHVSNQYLIPLAANQGSGTSREVVESAAKAGILKKITYPTGGSSTFFYNSNEAMIPEVDYALRFAPLGASSNAYQESYGAFLPADGQTYEQTFVVDHSTIELDEYGSNFTYNVYLNNFNTCPGNEKPCIGNLQITLTCVDCEPANYIAYYLSSMNDYENGASSGKVKLLPGKTYKLRKYPVGGTNSAGDVAVTVTGTKYVPPSSNNDIAVKVGGLRISKIISNPNGGLPVTTEFYYTNDITYKSSNPEPYITSGRINVYPKYDFLSDYTVRNQISGESTEVGVSTCHYRVMASGSLAPLATSGSPITYATVQKAVVGPTEILKSCYKYTTSLDFSDIVSYDFPTTVIISSDFRRGLLKEEQNYAFKNGTFIPVNKREYQYEFADYQRIPGMKFACQYTIVDNPSGFLNGCAIIKMPLYEVITNWLKKVTEISTDYSAGLTPLVVQTDYVYENALHQLPTQITTHNSKGELITTKIKYPQDYAGLTQTDNLSAGIKKLITSHVYTPVIEKTTYKSDANGSNQRMISSVFSTYNSNKPLPDAIDVIEITQPLTDFTTSTVDNGAVSRDSRYKPKLFFSAYDNSGNILQQNKADDISQSYIWDYASAYPTAQIINAEQTSVAYTSFEADGSGGWTISSTARTTDGITGNKCYQVSNGISKSGLNSSIEYVLSLWIKSGASISISGTTGNHVAGRSVDQWNFYTYTVSGTTAVSFSGTGLIDELRLYPKKAQMTTFTYNPLVGVTSQCDINNKIVYYEYDGFGRLKLIRDLDKNILKSFEYQLLAYTHANAVWINTGNTRCKPCASNNNYTVNILQNEEKDTNPNSSTYNQFRWVDAGTSTNCVISADWQFTSTAIRCKQAGGENTGEQEREQKDLNPCSQTYNTLRWVVTGVNTSVCPMSYVYARITLTNPGGGISDVVVAFFEDAACTMPVSVTNLVVNWQEEEYNDLNGTSTYNSYSTTCNGTETVLAYGAALYGPGPGQAVLYRYYSLLSGTGYAPTN